MKTLMTFIAVVALSGAALAVSASDVSGTWDLEMKWSGDQTSTGVCTFKQDGQKLGGTCQNFPISGQIRNGKLSWQFDVEQEGNKGRMEFDGELNQDGTAIEGWCSIVGGQDGTFTMKKQS